MAREIGRERYLQRLERAKGDAMIKIVTGMRRSGKSYLLFTLFYRRLIASGVDEKRIIRVDLEDRRNKVLRNPDELLAYIDSRINGEGMHYVLLDEVQHVEDFADVLNSYLKMENVDVYVTGSNSRFLSRDVATEFRGRGHEIRIYPLCFREFASVFDGPMEECLREYMTFGGLPKLPSIEGDGEKMQYLQGLFLSTYLKDILERYRIKNKRELGELLQVVASNIGGLTNTTKLYNSFRSMHGEGLSRNTIERYLNILEDVFMVSKVERYDVKGRRYIGSPVKFYFGDLGLRNAYLDFRQLEMPHLLENMLYNELLYMGFCVHVGMVTQHSKDEEGRSQRQQLEVDFVCNRGNERIYVQSAWHLPNPEKWVQELRSLQGIDDSFRKMIITHDNIKTHRNEDGITVMNLFDFLLGEWV